jgi:hypothetical protein
MKIQVYVARGLTIIGYLLPTWAAIHWHTSFMGDITPSIPFDLTLVLSAVALLVGQVWEWNLSEKRIRALSGAVPAVALC